MDVPVWKLRSLTGDPAGHWSIWVNGNWRIIFIFKEKERYWSITATITEELYMRRMFHPSHPGEILKHDVLPELGISVTEAAAHLGMSRVAFSRVINGRAAVSADLALRLADWLPPSAESWLRMQAAYDLWHASRKQRPRIKKAAMHGRLNHA